MSSPFAAIVLVADAEFMGDTRRKVVFLLTPEAARVQYRFERIESANGPCELHAVFNPPNDPFTRYTVPLGPADRAISSSWSLDTLESGLIGSHEVINLWTAMQMHQTRVQAETAAIP